MSFTNDDDINTLQSADLVSVGAGLGNDRYVLDALVLRDNQKITIYDTYGINTLQLVGGLEIVSSLVSSDALRLTLNNGSIITVVGADKFMFQTGGSSSSGVGGLVQDFSDFVTDSLGLASVPPAGADAVTGGTVTVDETGGTSGTGGGTTFTLTTSADSVNEGVADIFTVTASQAVTVDTVVKFKLTASSTAANAGTNLANLNDFNSGAFNEVSVTILAGQTTASTSISAITNDGTELSETYVMTATIGTTVLTKTITILDGSVGAGQTFQLTTGLDIIPGMNGSNGNSATSGNDTIIGVIEVANTAAAATATANSTFNSTDMINPGEGTDTLKLVIAGNVTAVSTDYTVPTNFSGVDILEVQSTATFADAGEGLIVDTSTVSDLGILNVTKSADVLDVIAAATTDIGVTMKAAGATVDVGGGKAVNVTLTDVAAAADVVSIGTGAGLADPAGAVTVSMTGSAYTVATGAHALSAVNVTGGTTISVTQKAASDASAAVADTGNVLVTQGAVNIVAGAATTSVNIKQDTAVQATNGQVAVAGTATTQDITFGAMTAGEIYSLDMGAGVIAFTAKKALTAAEAASAFANLIAGDDQGNASATLGLYSDNGANTSADTWASASVVTVDATHSKVVFSTSLSTEAAITDDTVVIPSTAAVAMTVGAVVAGIDAKSAITGNMGIAAGAVDIEDDAAHALTSITLDSYGNGSDIGSTTQATTNLATLNLSNVAETVTLVVKDTASTLALTLQNVGYDLNKNGATVAADLTFTTAPTTLNVTSTGNNVVKLVNTDNALATLNVAGTGLLDLSAASVGTGLKTVTVTGTAGLKLNGAESANITSVNSSATTGDTTATIDGAVATYTGGAGVDTVSLATSTALTKAIDLGAGNDTLSFVALAVTGSSATLSGGADIDTLSMSAAEADALDGSAQSFYTNFERLTINTVVGDADAVQDTTTLNLENLGFVNYVTTNGIIAGATPATDTDILVLDKMANNGTIVLAAAGTGAVNSLQTVNIKDAATGLTDVLNVVTAATTGAVLGTLAAAKVETINVTVNDTDASYTGTVPNVSTNTLILSADKATLVDLGGAGNLVLTFNAASTGLATINASDMTGGLTVTTLAGDLGVTTVTGGSAADTITLAGANDVAIGGAGGDTLVVTGAASAVTLTGGLGDDSFVVSAFTAANAGSAATITDLAVGETIAFKTGLNGLNFAPGKVTLISEATFTEYVTEAAAQAELASETFYDATVGAAAYAGGLAWFQFGTNTFIVQDVNGDGGFTDGTDIIVRLTGTIDLSASSFNTTNSTLEYL